MEFQIPKFIERQPKIVWMITYRQFIFLVLVAGGLGLLYLTLPSKVLFWFIAIFATAFSLVTIFVKIQGRPFPVVLWNLLRYSLDPKLYLWERKTAPPRLLKKIEIPEIKKEQDKGPSLEITEKGWLKKVTRKIKTGT